MALNVRYQDLGLLDFYEALRLQENIRDDILERGAEGCLYMVEHKHVITLGLRSNNGEDLNLPRAKLKELGIRVIRTDRGGKATYHGPGQLVLYPVIDLKMFQLIPKQWVSKLALLTTEVLDGYGIDAKVYDSKAGVWTENGKIASIGIHLKKGVSTHGIAINVSTDLSYFNLINPCGIKGDRTTSLEKETSRRVPLLEMKRKVIEGFGRILGVRMIPLKQ